MRIIARSTLTPIWPWHGARPYHTPPIMPLRLAFVLTLCVQTTLFAQRTDTLTFYSEAFQQERTVLVQLPMAYKYRSEQVTLPVIYILDGQHEWFADPVRTAIEYLQYTHQIPQSIVVSIPLLNRNEECGIRDLDAQVLPLHQFITKELDEQLQQYRTSGYRLLIGHSFSASFALYSHLKAPSYYAAVIANTPLDSFKKLVLAFQKDKRSDISRIHISVGGKAKHEDHHHRTMFDTLAAQFPTFFDSVTTFVAHHSGHTAVPIVATPSLLTGIFSQFNGRYAAIAMVDDEYKLIDPPGSVADELLRIKKASTLDRYAYPPEIADLNGLSSRYLNSGHTDHGLALLDLALQYYPNFFDFHFQRYELLLPTDPELAKVHLNRTHELLRTLETDLPEQQELLDIVASEKKRNGW